MYSSDNLVVFEETQGLIENNLFSYSFVFALSLHYIHILCVVQMEGYQNCINYNNF